MKIHLMLVLKLSQKLKRFIPVAWTFSGCRHQDGIASSLVIFFGKNMYSVDSFLEEVQHFE